MSQRAQRLNGNGLTVQSWFSCTKEVAALYLAQCSCSRSLCAAMHANYIALGPASRWSHTHSIGSAWAVGWEQRKRPGTTQAGLSHELLQASDEAHHLLPKTSNPSSHFRKDAVVRGNSRDSECVPSPGGSETSRSASKVTKTSNSMSQTGQTRLVFAAITCFNNNF